MATVEQIVVQALNTQPSTLEGAAWILGLAGLFIGYKIVKEALSFVWRVTKYLAPLFMLLYILMQHGIGGF